MRRLGVGLQVDFVRAEGDPFAVWRQNGLVHALQRHHVFEGEGALAFSLGRAGRETKKGDREYSTHNASRETG